MKLNKSYLFELLLVAAQLTFGLSLSETSPAFLWSSRHFRPWTSGSKEAVNYRSIASHELASLVLAEGGWSEVVCSRENREPTADVALLFVGRTLHSSDISRDNHADPALVDILKHSFTTSNSSMAFPYVTKSDATESLENSLLSDILKACGNGAEEGHTVAISESCSVHGDDFVKLRDLQSVQEHLTSKAGLRANGQAHLVLFCSDGSLKSEHAQSEGEELAALTDAMEKLGTPYTVLYASDPHKSHLYVTDRALERFLAEGSQDALLNSTNCDGVCQIKSSLLEGIFVAVVLLIILLSGLCCMMGIDTPTRFETPQES